MGDGTGRAGFGNRVKQARIAARLTQHELAERLDSRALTISRWECGVQEPGAATLSALAEVLGVTERWLTTGEERASSAA